jgi:hypothetical protein
MPPLHISPIKLQLALRPAYDELDVIAEVQLAFLFCVFPNQRFLTDSGLVL